MRYLLLALIFFATGCEILEEDISRREVMIVTPADRVIIPAGNIDFRWRAVDFATGYELTVASPSFAAAERIAIDTVIFADTLQRRFGCRVALDAGEYEWSVTGFNPGYKTRTQLRSLRIVPVEEPETPEPSDPE